MRQNRVQGLGGDRSTVHWLASVLSADSSWPAHARTPYAQFVADLWAKNISTAAGGAGSSHTAQDLRSTMAALPGTGLPDAKRQGDSGDRWIRWTTATKATADRHRWLPIKLNAELTPKPDSQRVRRRLGRLRLYTFARRSAAASGMCPWHRDAGRHHEPVASQRQPAGCRSRPLARSQG